MAFDKIRIEPSTGMTLPERIGVSLKRVHELQIIMDQLIEETRDHGELILEIAGRDDLTPLEKTYSAFVLGMQMQKKIDNPGRDTRIKRARLS